MIRRFRSIWALLRNYKFQSIFFSYFKALVSIILVIVCVFGLFAYLMYTSSRRNELASMIEKNFTRSADMLDVIFQSLENDYLTIAGHEQVLRIAGDSPEALKSAVAQSSGYYMAAVRPLTLICAGNRIYKSIYVYCPKNDHIIAWTNFASRETFADTAWIDHAGTGQAQEWVRTEPLVREQVISIARPIRKDGQLVGVVVFNLNFAYISTIMHLDALGRSGQSVIVPQSGQIIFSPDETLINRQIADCGALNDVYRKKSEYSGRVQVERLNSQLAMSYSSGSFSLLSIVREADYANIRGSLYTTMIFGILISAILAVILSLFMSLRLYDYILSIVAMIQTPSEGGEFNTLFPAGPNAEMRFIRNNILSMIDRNKSIEVEFDRHLSELHKAQKIALQTQMNPHFLLNTLQIVNFSIMQELRRDSKATHIIALLSDVLRNNLDTKNYLTDLQSEIRFARKYLEIETIRSSGAFRIVWQIEPRIDDCMVVKGMLQPILENSVMHGLLDSGKDSRILGISAHLEQDRLIIRVEDNGRGMNAATLENLQKMLNSDHLPESLHIGLSNINMRIRLIFGDQGKLTVDSEEGVGTTVSISLPVIRQANFRSGY